MITAQSLEAAELMLGKYEKRTQENLVRHDRVYVQVRKADMLVLLQLARTGQFAIGMVQGREAEKVESLPFVLEGR